MSRATIVIAEDHAELSLALREVLEQEGYHAVEARNGEEALGALRREAPAPCLVVLDLMMPRVNGWDVLRAIENGGAPRSPVIITTAQEGDWVAEARKHPFVVATLRKPYNIDELISLVETYCPRSES